MGQSQIGVYRLLTNEEPRGPKRGVRGRVCGKINAAYGEYRTPESGFCGATISGFYGF